MNDLAAIDEAAANAWPAPVTQRRGGWTLRFGWGATRRANSAWPGTVPVADPDAAIEEVIAFYRAWRLPPRVQITPGLVGDLDARLAGRGWATDGGCHIMTADLDRVIAATPEAVDIAYAATPDDAWVDQWWSTGRGGTAPPAAWRIVGLPLPCATHARRLGDGGACVGRGVVERGWLGIFALATHPELRGRGHATAVLGGLARWARAQGARRAYLQVEVDNEAAKRLFTGVGFATIGGYHYRTCAES